MLSADDLYGRLEASYGEPGWWSDDPFTVMFQSVLVQNTAWTSVLRTCGSIGEIAPERIASMSREELEDLIRPCGFAKSKSIAISGLTEWFGSYGNDPGQVVDVSTDILRSELLSIRGIGGETALVRVDGEEDLAVLPCLVMAPEGSRIVYGMPGRCMMEIAVNGESRGRAEELLSRMEEME